MAVSAVAPPASLPPCSTPADPPKRPSNHAIELDHEKISAKIWSVMLPDFSRFSGSVSMIHATLTPHDNLEMADLWLNQGVPIRIVGGQTNAISHIPTQC